MEEKRLILNFSVKYHISLLKLHYRSFFTHNPKTSWFFKHKWVASRPFLRKLMVGLMLFLASFNFVLFVPDLFKYSPISGGCTETGSDVVFYTLVSFALITLLTVVVFGFLLFRAKDVYKVKIELSILALYWLATVVAYMGYGFTERLAQRNFSTDYLVVIGIFVTFVLCNVVPLIYAYRFDRSLGAEGSLLHFKYLLESVEFRNAFYKFLTTQFCQENLQFYEVVTEWKNLPLNDPSCRSKARSIISVFVVDTGVCQINITAPLRSKIMTQIERDPLPCSIFDEVLECIVVDMHLDSFRQFKNKFPGVVFFNRSDSTDTSGSFSSQSEIPLKPIRYFSVV